MTECEPVRASWEGIARILQAENAPDAEVAERLGCRESFVARVRRELGMEPWPVRANTGVRWPRRDAHEVSEETRQRFFEQRKVTDDGHRRWLGRHLKDGTPLFVSGQTAYRVAFRIGHGQDPIGQIRVECEMPHCVEGGHLSDRLMRDQAVQQRLPGQEAHDAHA
ncbi:hypothetical protein [Streptomyces carpinensis]|uniref:Uncharacterized protein n=1 Tax=Streptomyces carpinensis TaxID=66369 RepID=A0ABV1VVR1_9ACTN|nr:hypothetical protein [Streptomyces carpinensis]